MTTAGDPSEVGETPLLEVDIGLEPTLFAKAEWFNQVSSGHGGGSVKTRIGKSMIDAERASPTPVQGRTLLEASTGNTGAAVARFGVTHGLEVEVVMPDDAGRGKIAAMDAAGADMTVIESKRGYDANVEACRRKAQRNPDEYVYLDQYTNPANPGIHAGTTGPEIWRQTSGSVTHFVAGAGTGGTLVGVSHALRDRGVDIYGLEPATGCHDIADLKHMHESGFSVPEVYDPGAVETMSFVPTDVAHDYVAWLRDRYRDRSVTVADSGQWSRSFVQDHLRVDGQFIVGPSSGACVAMVHRLATMDVLDASDVVVVPLSDRGDRYPDRGLEARAIGTAPERPKLPR